MVKKNLHRLVLIKQTTYYHKNERHHKHGQYNSSVNECMLLIDCYLRRQVTTFTLRTKQIITDTLSRLNINK